MEGLQQEAWALLRAARFGVLSTLSVRVAGYPFGSVMPFALEESSGGLIVLMSGLAEHTKNALTDPRASLLVLEDGKPDADPQEAARLTVVGNLERAAATAVDHARAVYLARHPQAQRNLELADFSFWMLRPLHARFIAGFGRMGWLDAATLLP
jgi:putative heme iron utilization protein